MQVDLSLLTYPCLYQILVVIIGGKKNLIIEFNKYDLNQNEQNLSRLILEIRFFQRIS